MTTTAVMRLMSVIGTNAKSSNVRATAALGTSGRDVAHIEFFASWSMAANRRANFLWLHNAVFPTNRVVGCSLQTEGKHEAARVHIVARRRGGGMAAYGAGAAGAAHAACRGAHELCRGHAAIARPSGVVSGRVGEIGL